LLLVGAYRDNEVGPAHPLLRTLNAIRDADAGCNGLWISSLNATSASTSSPQDVETL
jgi:predicted ATPase